MIVVDTNVISELTRSRVAPAVQAWADSQPIDTLHVTAISEAELLFGLACRPGGRRADDLRRAVLTVFGALFSGRVLPFDSMAAAEYAELAADFRRAGKPTGPADMQIAAIARARGADLVATRNIRDFTGCGIALIDPWQS